MLAHLSEMVAATDIPLNADFEMVLPPIPTALRRMSPAASRPEWPDSRSAKIQTNDAKRPLYDFDLSVTRVKAARAAVDRAGGDVVLTARAENFFRGVPDLEDAIRRLEAYAAAGADCLYAPGIRTREQIETVVNATAPKPVNFLTVSTDFTVSDIAAMGVRRISVGGQAVVARR